MTSQPYWLTAALKEHPARAPHDAPGAGIEVQADLEPGDLWVFSEHTDPHCGVQRVVLILDTDVKTGTVTAALASTEIDLADDRDILLSADETGSGYALIVETAMVARLPWPNAHNRVGMVDDLLVDLIVDFIWGEHLEGLDDRRGHPWVEPSNSTRVEFDERELKDLERLAKKTDGRFNRRVVEPTATPTADAARALPMNGFEATGFLVDALQCALHTLSYREVVDLQGDIVTAMLPVPDFDPAMVTLSDLRMLLQPEVDALLSGPSVVELNCIDGITRRLVETTNCTNEDRVVLISPALVEIFGRSGLIGTTSDHRTVFVTDGRD